MGIDSLAIRVPCPRCGHRLDTTVALVQEGARCSCDHCHALVRPRMAPDQLDDLMRSVAIATRVNSETDRILRRMMKAHA